MLRRNYERLMRTRLPSRTRFEPPTNPYFGFAAVAMGALIAVIWFAGLLQSELLGKVAVALIFTSFWLLMCGIWKADQYIEGGRRPKPPDDYDTFISA